MLEEGIEGTKRGSEAGNSAMAAASQMDDSLLDDLTLPPRGSAMVCPFSCWRRSSPDMAAELAVERRRIARIQSSKGSTFQRTARAHRSGDGS